MLLEAIGPPGRCRGGVVVIYWVRRPRVNPYESPLRARGPGRGRPAATGSLANAIGRAKTAEGSRACFSPAFRARAWVPKNLARRNMDLWFRRRDAARGDRAAWAVLRLLAARCRRPDRISWPREPPVILLFHPYAREGQAVVGPLLRGRSPTRSVAPKQQRGLGRASLRHFGLARKGDRGG